MDIRELNHERIDLEGEIVPHQARVYNIRPNLDNGIPEHSVWPAVE
jgi:hypothetical protein